MWNIPIEGFLSTDTELQNLLEKCMLGKQAALPSALGGPEGMEEQVITHVVPQ